jgi:hypothetical protein
MAAVFNRRASAILDAKLVGLPAPTRTSSLSLSSRRESQAVDGVTLSDSSADEFSGFPLTDEIGTRDLATLSVLSEEAILQELERR